MLNKTKYHILTFCIASVWLVNGLFCKVLSLVPRHEQIVGRILGTDAHSTHLLTICIGFSEICMAIWVLTKLKSKWSALIQITVVAIMNILEFTLVPNLLLWGRWNAFFAFLFILFVYYNEFVLREKVSTLLKK